MSSRAWRPRVALEGVRSEQQLADVMARLLTRTPRWGRLEILQYLPPAWHDAAEAYFDGNELRTPEQGEHQWSDVEAVPLDRALQRVSTFAPADAQWQEALRERRAAEAAVHIPAEAPTPAGASDIVGHVLSALHDEIHQTRRQRLARFEVRAGALVGTHQWGVAYDCVFPKSRQPELHEMGWFETTDGRRVPARVVDATLRHHTLVADEAVPGLGEGTFFMTDPAALLRAEYAQLQMLRDTPAGLELRRSGVVIPAAAATDPADLPELSGLSREQLAAVRTVLEHDVSYVWGPPGTGKTTTLAGLLEACFRMGKRVLVLSNNNVAVDQAVSAAARRFSWPEGSLVRLGRRSDEVSLTERQRQVTLHIDSHLERFAEATGVREAALQLARAAAAEAGIAPTAPPTVAGALQVLQEATTKLAKRGSRYAEQNGLPLALKNLRAQFRAPMGQVLARAHVVATTLTMEMLSLPVDGLVFDQVIIDEASVMRTSEVIRVQMRRGRRIAYFGDPRQLPPVVVAGTAQAKQWLARNPFNLAGLDDPDRLIPGSAILTRQHRMAAPIRALVSRLFYSGRLVDGENAPASGQILLVDTSATRARCSREYLTNGYSRYNLEHVHVGTSIVDTVGLRQKHWTIRVMSPYRLQRTKYEEHPLFSTLRGARCRVGTIHSSQGAEADLVIVDLTVAPGGSRSRFLDDRSTEALPNLLNVALSRAKTLLVVLAHVRHLQDEYKGLLIERLVSGLASQHPTFDAGDGNISTRTRAFLQEHGWGLHRREPLAAERTP